MTSSLGWSGGVTFPCIHLLGNGFFLLAYVQRDKLMFPTFMRKNYFTQKNFIQVLIFNRFPLKIIPLKRRIFKKKLMLIGIQFSSINHFKETRFNFNKNVYKGKWTLYDSRASASQYTLPLLSLTQSHHRQRWFLQKLIERWWTEWKMVATLEHGA